MTSQLEAFDSMRKKKYGEKEKIKSLKGPRVSHRKTKKVPPTLNIMVNFIS